jgi:hypothetical protein
MLMSFSESRVRDGDSIDRATHSPLSLFDIIYYWREVFREALLVWKYTPAGVSWRSNVHVILARISNAQVWTTSSPRRLLVDRYLALVVHSLTYLISLAFLILLYIQIQF